MPPPSWLAAATAAMLLPALGGCAGGASVTVDIEVPRPLVEPIDLPVGVYFEDALKSFVHLEEVDEQGAYSIDIGASQEPVFARVFNAVFTDVIPVEQASPPAAAPQASGEGAAEDGEEDGADSAAETSAEPTPFRRAGGEGNLAGIRGVLAPTIEEVQFATPKQTKLDFFEVWIRYRIRLFDTAGNLRTEWPLIGYGKVSGRNHGDEAEALNAAAIWALRDAAAVLAFELREKAQLEAGSAGAEGNP